MTRRMPAIARLSVREAIAISKGKNFTCIETYLSLIHISEPTD